ncbi:unnamed protein product, partial [Heterotrigona itama]
RGMTSRSLTDIYSRNSSNYIAPVSHWYLLVASEAKPIKDRTVESHVTISESTQQIVISVGSLSDCFYDSTTELHQHTPKC